MENKLIISSSPHIRSNETVRSVMGDVLIALMPALIGSIYFFRVGAIINIISGIAGAVIAEVIMQKIMKKEVTIDDLSAVVTGLLLAFNVPPTAPWWMTFVGGFFAIAVAKQMFGGLGHNYINPALAARVMLLASYPVLMTTWQNPVNFDPASVVSSATKATSAASDVATSATDAVSAVTPLLGIHPWGSYHDLLNMFLGNIPGTIGETSKLLLLIGAAYLVYKGVIKLLIPCTYILTVAIFTFIFSGFDPYMAAYNVLAGGLILGAFFMATDYTTSPMTKKGQVIYALGCGLITSVIRYFGGYPEGVSYSILLMNVCTPMIDKYVRPKRFGEVAK